MIYKINNKKIKKALLDFNKTLYGKTMLLICYAPFLFGFVLTFVGLILFYKYTYSTSVTFLVVCVLFSLISFCVGSYNFYRELRVYVNNKK